MAVYEAVQQMPRPKLKNLPLVEAIFEIRWALQQMHPEFELDPHYKLLVGRLFDRVHAEYPEHEPLPTAALPDAMVAHTVQHRFRKTKNDWPLIQVGPGILTVNETRKYDWEDFRNRCNVATTKLFEAHPKASELRIESVLLRYINVVDFDHRKQNVFSFLREKMRIAAELPDNLFESGAVNSKPESFAWQSNFLCQRPAGAVILKLDTGLKEKVPVLRWETMVLSAATAVPEMPSHFDDWLTAAHEIQDDWFFKLIAGELEKRFNA